MLGSLLSLLVLSLGNPASIMTNPQIEYVDRPNLTESNTHYGGNRAPLAPSAFVKLPVGAVKPKGFLLEYLKRQRDGLTGNLQEISLWLQKDKNAWLSPNGEGEYGWEEVPYWLKGYGNLAYLLEEPEMIAETKIWIEGALNSQREDGNFGPLLTFDDDGSQDFWANMIMLFCLQSYYEHSRDPRVISLMTNYFKFQLTVPDEKLLTHYWQYLRGGDNLYSIYWLYNKTGDAFLLELAEKIHRNTADWTQPGTLPNWHNVNIAQSFGEPATYYLQSKSPLDLRYAYKNFDKIRELYGDVPGGMFGGDENSRPGFRDPRQSIETCGIVEQMLSDETLFAITGDPFWADHCEEVAFNSYPASTLPDFRGLRYLTSPNQVTSDRHSHSPGIQNGGPMFLMNPLSHRCCQHNHSHGWPYFVEHLFMATPDNGLVAAMYSESEVTAKVGNGATVKISEKTHYPFRDEIIFSIEPEAPVEFPLYLRVPGWCQSPEVKINGKVQATNEEKKGFVRIYRLWKKGDSVTLRLPMQVEVQKYRLNQDSVSVNYGPLTFSLKIGEDYKKISSTEHLLHDARYAPGVDPEKWPAFEILPTTAWNYALDETAVDQLKFEVREKPWPKNSFPWTPESVPLEIKTLARKIPEWQMDIHGLVSVLQPSPALTNQKLESVTLIPMGAARLRISAFPVASTNSAANRWIPPQTLPKPLPYHPEASHCFSGDSPDALCDQVHPKSSADQSIKRLTFWDHKGTSEWVQYRFDEPRRVNRVEVYWYDDTGFGQCRTPLTWRVLYKDGDEWKPVDTTVPYGTKLDQFNVVAFKSITTSALRLEIQLKPDFSAGILEWKVGP